MAMFENIGVFFKRFMQNDKKELLAENPLSQSKETAKDRLHVVLMQDRANVSADFLEMMKEEIIEVIKKYIVVDESKIDVRLTNEENEDGSIGAPLLHANIPILNIRNDLKGEYMYNHKSEENSEVKKEEKVVSEKTQIVQVIKEQDLEENSVEENNVNVNNPKIIEEENNINVSNPKIIENDETPKVPEIFENSNDERIEESVNEIQKNDIIHDTIEVNKVDEQVLEEQKNQDLQQENSEEQALELEEIENLDEEDDDVTFDDLLKAAEEEEERLKQLGQYDNKKENNDTEDENNQEETENIETKVEDNGENIDSKIEDNSKEVKKVKKISSNSKTTTKKRKKTTKTSSKTKNK